MLKLKEVKKYAILIPDADDWTAVKIMRCFLNVPNIKFYLLSNKKNTITRRSKYCSTFFYKNYHNENEWLENILEISKNNDIDIVIPSTDEGFSLIVKNQTIFYKNNLNIPHLPNEETYEQTRDKWLFYRFLIENDLPTESALLLGEKDNLQVDINALKNFTYPSLIKPASERGGFGITYLDSFNKFNATWGKITQNGYPGKYYMQGYIPGFDISMAVYCRNGIIYEYAIHKSYSATENYFGPQRIMEFIDDKNLVSIAEKCLKELEWNGIACIDFRIDSRDNNPKIIELNPRFGQALLGWYSAGINFPLVLLLDAFDKPYPGMDYKKIKYAHPKAQIKMLIKNIFRKNISNTFNYKGGLNFSIRDPLPEIYFIFQKIFNR